MERLSRDLGLGCLASARVGDDMVMLAVTGPPQPFGSRVQVGERVPIAPPLGLAFIAWADAATIEDYLDLSGRKLTAAERRQYSEALELVRDRGYGVVLDSSTRHRLVERLRAPRDLDDSRRHHAARRNPRRARARRLRAGPRPRGSRVRGHRAHRAGLRARRRGHPGLDPRRLLRVRSGPTTLPRYAARMFEATTAIQAAMTA